MLSCRGHTLGSWSERERERVSSHCDLGYLMTWLLNWTTRTREDVVVVVVVGGRMWWELWLLYWDNGINIIYIWEFIYDFSGLLDNFGAKVELNRNWNNATQPPPPVPPPLMGNNNIVQQHNWWNRNWTAYPFPKGSPHQMDKVYKELLPDTVWDRRIIINLDWQGCARE